MPSPLPSTLHRTRPLKPGASLKLLGHWQDRLADGEAASPAHSARYGNTRHASCSLGRLRWEAAKSMSECWVFCFFFFFFFERNIKVQQFESEGMECAFLLFSLTPPFPARRGHMASTSEVAAYTWECRVIALQGFPDTWQGKQSLHG